MAWPLQNNYATIIAPCDGSKQPSFPFFTARGKPPELRGARAKKQQNVKGNQVAGQRNQHHTP
jgi:hypothetical protein